MMHHLTFAAPNNKQPHPHPTIAGPPLSSSTTTPRDAAERALRQPTLANELLSRVYVSLYLIFLSPRLSTSRDASPSLNSTRYQETTLSHLSLLPFPTRNFILFLSLHLLPPILLQDSDAMKPSRMYLQIIRERMDIIIDIYTLDINKSELINLY